MHFLYQILDFCFPFSFMEYTFMKNAFLAMILVTPLFALLGTMAVNNKMAFFSDALGHSAFTGIALGVLLGFDDPIFSMLAFGIFLGLMISKVKSFHTSSSDTIISVFSSAAMALGIVILSKNGGFARYATYLIGDILTVSPMEIGFLFLVLIVITVLWFFLYNQLLLISINSSLAASRGVKVTLIENIFVVMVAVAVMLSIKWIGVLTINSLLILPAASARNIATNSRTYHWLTTILAVISGVGGLLLSYDQGTSAGASMVLIAVGFFFLTFLIRYFLRR